MNTPSHQQIKHRWRLTNTQKLRIQRMVKNMSADQRGWAMQRVSDTEEGRYIMYLIANIASIQQKSSHDSTL